MDFRGVLELEKKNLENTERNCGALLQHLPKGRLSVQIKKGSPYYRKIKDDGTEISISRDDKSIELLTGRRVAEQAMKNAAYNHKMLENMLKNYKAYDPNELVRLLSPAYQNISRAHIEAMGFPYLLDLDGSTSAPDLHPEHLTQTDSNGNKRRSKSELGIDAVYHELGLDPDYEDTIILPDGFEFHPDFSLWCPLWHRKKFHEHIGNVGNPKTLAITTRKFEELVTFGYYPFRDFIFTFEDPDGNINLQEIKILIETFMR